jgi:hypothetical protein
VLAVVFLLLVAFSYEDFVAAALERRPRHVAGWIVGLVGFDATVLAVNRSAQTRHRPRRQRRAATVAMVVDLV